MSSSARLPPDPDASGRPRNRRLASGNPSSSSTSTSLLSGAGPSTTPDRGISPIPAARIGRGGSSGRGSKPASSGGSLLDASWAPSWASVQGFASSILTGSDTYGSDTEVPSRRGARPRKPLRRLSSGGSRRLSASWGPAPPTSRPRIEDVAAGSLAEREAALRAMKTASVLEGHSGAGGILDSSGNFKRRTSDEDLRSAAQGREEEHYLVYIHHVQPADTYAGIVLKYRCREDAFRKANGLWSRDNIQIRKWLALPVDACELKGRPCEAPSYYSQHVDHLAPTPQPSQHGAQDVDDFFAAAANGNGKAAEAAESVDQDERSPWTHVRWVKMDSLSSPVEIGRVSRKALGYFPPRRKKSLHTASTLSTPRRSLDVPSIALSEPIDSPGSTSSHRHISRTQLAHAYGVSTPKSSRSRGGSGGDDLRPGWMRRPGGVGSMGRNVRAPGPEKDYFNSWTKKHMPGLNLDSMPSMSVMGSETAQFGFDAEAGAIVENPLEGGRDVSSLRRNGSGLDKAAATIETWLRGAFAKRPGTPIIGPRSRQQDDGLGDLIELEDTNSDDGRLGAAALSGISDPGLSLLSSASRGSSRRREGEGTLRGRSLPSSESTGPRKGKKAD